MCDNSSSVNKKIHEKYGNIRASRLHVRKSCRVRSREPFRVALKTIIKSLKIRKPRAKCKRFIRKTVPFSSVLYSIVSNYKQWNITFTKKQDSFFSNFFENALIHAVKYNASERKILLSGDIELNRGPTFYVNSSLMMCREGSNSVFNCRLRRVIVYLEP